MNTVKLEKQIFEIKTKADFEKIALQVFKYQAENNSVYKEYINNLCVKVNEVKNIKQIPFLPIEFFKSKKVICKNRSYEIIFTSSGTTGENTSKHLVADLKLYEESFLKAFKEFYGKIDDYCILALLPNYLEREGSSLIYMTEQLIKESKNNNSGFYLYDYEKLIKTIKEQQKQNNKIILLGVTYALLDIAENYELNLKDVIVMETGGMKGKRKEMTRSELHEFLCNKFKIKEIHSEYGMTELLSQAYSKGNGIFETPAWMEILIRDATDPFTYLEENKVGGINVIDLANLYSCSFIETQDLGKIEKGDFEILGRFDKSQIRGCNLLVAI